MEVPASGFFATHREHGSIPVILTMMRLDDPLADERQIVVASHNLSGHEIDCEVDLIALSTDRDGTVAMLSANARAAMSKSKRRISRTSAGS